jgi:molecular chaperone HtpG
VRQLLDLVIHSLYSNKEIFLRELISNASDACDKLRFEALSDDALFEGDSELEIDVRFDKAARTIRIRDNGIGMSRAEVIEHIGTIAKSGTREFFSKLTGDQAKDSRLIGQFGVGFYSAFIVADKVTLLTRRAGLTPEHGVRWESSGEGDYSIETIERPARGTEIILHLRDGLDEFLDHYRLREIITKYSDHIALPIRMPKPDGKPDGEKDETVNRASALWARAKSDITADEHNEFYKHIAHDFEPPLAHLHARVEGKQEYIALLYIPARAPFDLWDRGGRRGVKLYVRRVFIMDDAEQLLPPYLRFVRGVVDSADLPLNISREILQESRDIEAIRAGCTKRILDLLDDMAGNEPDKFATVWREFGAVLKEGVIDDQANRERIAKLLRFASTLTDTDSSDVSLSAYVGRMKPDQKAIYYLTAPTFATARSSPQLEAFRKRGIEVLLLSDRVDEWLVMHLHEFDGKPLQSAAKGAFDENASADDAEKNRQTEQAEKLAPLVARVKASLGERVQDVRLSARLTDSPSCLVYDENALGGNLERILKAAGQKAPASKPILELNADHPLVTRLDGESDASRFERITMLLFDQAQLVEGTLPEDPAAFVRRMNETLLNV